MNLNKNRFFSPLNTVLFLLITLFTAGCSEQNPVAEIHSSERIISLAPNITEIAFALGLGDRMVGTTTFCNYPEAAKETAKIGNYANLNYEAIVALHPDLVLLLTEYDEAKSRLRSLGISYLEINSFFISDILASIQTVGEATDCKKEATSLIAHIRSRIAHIQSVSSNERPRVLITFSRQNPNETIEQIYAIGPGCIHHELLELAGGKNCIEGTQAFVTLSREALIRLNPAIIIELAPDMKTDKNATEAWNAFETVAAVKNKKITVLTGDYTCIPGPRFIQTLEDFHRIILGSSLTDKTSM